MAAVREAENDPLVRQSGADVVIISAEAAGRMLGVATQSPAVSGLIEDLLAYGKGLDVYERAIQPEEVGKPLVQGDELVVAAVVRDGTYLTPAPTPTSPRCGRATGWCSYSLRPGGNSEAVGELQAVGGEQVGVGEQLPGGAVGDDHARRRGSTARAHSSSA